MSVNQLKWGSVLSYVQMILNICIGLIYTPIMIRLLGQSEYGLYNTVSSVISMLGILNLGFSSSYIRYFAKYKEKKNRQDLYKMNGLFLAIFVVIGCIALVCGVFLIANITRVFGNGLTNDELKTARVLMLLLTINLVLSFPMSVFANIITANERFIFLKVVNMIKTVLTPILVIPLLLLGFGSIAVVVVTIVLAFVVDILNIYYVIVVLNNKFIFGGVQKHIVVDLFSYTVFIALNIIIDQINWNIDKFLLGRYRGTTAVAIYSVGANLQVYYQMFSTAISGIFTPRIHIILSSQEKSDKKMRLINDMFILVGRIQYIILALVCSGFVFFGKEFIFFWAGNGYDEAYYVALLLMIPVSIPLIQNLGIEIQRAMNKHQFRSIAYMFMAIINLCISIILCKKYGPIGAAFGTTVSLIVANGIVMNVYYALKCHLDIKNFWLNILKISVSLIAPCTLGVFMKVMFDFYSILNLFIGIVVYMCCYGLSVWKLGMNDTEKKFVLQLCKRLAVRKV